MKKKLLLIVFMLLFALPFVSADASLSADLIRYEPIPAQPGQYVDAYISLENIGDVDANNVFIEVIQEFPFTLVGESVLSVPVLKSQRSYVADFKLKVDSQAVIGNNNLKVRYSFDGSSWQERSFTIDVKSNEVSLSIVDVSFSPEEIIPGQEGIINLKLKNSESIVLRNIGVKLGLFTLTPTSYIDLPFIPMSSATEQKIGRLNPDEVSDVSFTIKAYPDATPGFYKIPLTLTFYDDQGSKTEISEIIGVVVKSVPELNVYVEKTTISQANQIGDITLKFVNKGINDLKFLDVTLDGSSDYEILSIPQEYIGDLDSDDYRSETFTINSVTDSFDLKVSVSYKDENNNNFLETIIVPFETANDLTDAKKNPSFSTILLIIVLVIALFYWVRNKRRNKHHKK